MRLPVKRGLFAVFEAVVNGIQSAAENPTSRKPAVTVRVLRSLAPTIDDPDNQDVVGFEVVDNGQGFNPKNWDSFQKTDSLHKYESGGKGIGRLLWLKVFDSISIASICEVDGAKVERKFRFSVSGVSPPQDTLVDENRQFETVVTLKLPKSEYSESLQGSATQQAHRILSHTLELFLAEGRPSVVIEDSNQGATVKLSDVLDKELCAEIQADELVLDGHEFKIHHLLRNGRAGSRHEIIFCAAGREIQSVRLDEHIPALRAARLETEGGSARYSALVSGKSLNSLASSDRQGLLWISVDDGENVQLRLERVCEEVARKCRQYLDERLSPLQDQQKSRVEQFLQEAPYYSYLYRNYPSEFEHVSPDATDRELDVEFYKVEAKHGEEAREEMQSFLGHVPSTMTLDERAKLLSDIILRVNQVGQSKLAKHVAYRRAILSFLEQSLEQDSGTYQYEEVLHSTIWPKQCNAFTPEASAAANLWLVDDRFSFHLLVASDEPISDKLGRGHNPESGKPDVLIFQRALAFADSKDQIGSAIILELKRPGRERYKFGDEKLDPVYQVTQYARELKSGDALDLNGAALSMAQHTPIFAYIIADLKGSLGEILDLWKFKVMPDGIGRYMYDDSLNMMIEVLPFRKLVADAKRRNHMLFHKLGLASEGV